MNFNMEQMCNIGGCVLIFVLLALLVFKPNGLMSLLEGNSNNNNKSANNKPAVNNNRAVNNKAANNNAGNNSMELGI